MILDADVAARAYDVDLATGGETPLGATPLHVEVGERPRAIILRAPEHEAQRVLLVEPLADGAKVVVTLPPKAVVGATQAGPPAPGTSAAAGAGAAAGPPRLVASPEQCTALDKTLRIQRLFLRGEIGEAQKAVDHLAETFGETYASLMLKGHVAAASGEIDAAERFYRQLENMTISVPDGADAPRDANAAGGAKP